MSAPEDLVVKCPLCHCDGIVGRDEAEEYERLRAVVAVQREALRKIERRAEAMFGSGSTFAVLARAALDAEGVSEPGAPEAIGDSWPRPVPGSLTSPLSLDERIRRAEGVSEPGVPDSQSVGPGSLTSPVDTALRMQNELQEAIDALPPAEPGTPRIVSVEVEPS